MDNTWLIVINPAAGRGKTLTKWPIVEGLLRKNNIGFSARISQLAGDCNRLTREGIASGFRKIISVGGDGTHHEVVNGILASGLPASETTLGIIPVGTGNDWARTLGIGSSIEQAIDTIARGETILHSAGKIEFSDSPEANRYFANVAGLCLDSVVVQKVSRKALSIFGTLAYFFGGLYTALGYRAPSAVIVANDQTFSGRFVTIHAGICRYSGGGMSFTPHADPTRGDFAVTFVKNSTKLSLLANMYRAYNKSIGRYKHAHLTHCNTLMVTPTGNSAIWVEADGENIGKAPVMIRCLPRAFRVTVPDSTKVRVVP